jgi:hypothetical protein
MTFSPPRLLSSVLLAGLLTWLLCWQPLSWPGPLKPAHLVLRLASQGPTEVSVRLDEGHGIDDIRTSDLTTHLGPDTLPHNLTFPLPAQRLHALRIAFLSTPAVVISNARLVFDDRSSVDFTTQLQPDGATLLQDTPSGLLFQQDPRTPAVQSLPPLPTITATWRLAEPLLLPAGDEPSAAEWLGSFILLAILLVLLQGAFERLPFTPWGRTLSSLADSLAQTARKRRRLTLALVALGASLLSCYPVAFGHKSFVSPNTYPFLLYTGSPTLPGATWEPTQNTQGSDTAATLLYSVPTSAVVHDAIFRDHEFPFWNRYASGGLPLFAQGQTMFGNPLHFLAIAANAASWAWDLKFLLAKALFSWGIALCVWHCTRRLGVAALVGASAAWIGFFAYRLNHPAFFSLSFAPWLLLPWWIALQASSRRDLFLAMLGLVFTDICELTSGTAKEACMLLIFMNAAGVLLVALHPQCRAFRLQRLSLMLAASLCFLLLSAPHWLLFLDAVRQGISCYEKPVVYQLPPPLLAGFFDDIFSQDFTPLAVRTHPSLNFLVLFGLLWLFAVGLRSEHRATIISLLVTALPLAALVFGVVPPNWIKTTPFLGNIYHVHNTFGLPLVVLLLLLSGIGLGACLDRADSPRWKGLYLRVVATFLCLLSLYLGYTQSTPPPLLPSFAADLPSHSRFFVGYASALIVAFLFLAFGFRWAGRRGSSRIAGFLIVGACLFVLHFRHGMYVHTRFDDHLMTPRAAADLAAPSPAIERIRHLTPEPYRTAGVDLIFSPDYNALVRLEGITNLDALFNPYYAAFLRATHIPNTSGARVMLPEAALPTLKPALDFLNLRYYLRAAKRDQPPVPQLARIAIDDLEIDESPEAWPRAFFSDQVRHYSDVSDLASLIQHGDGRPFAAIQDSQPDPSPSSLSDHRIVPATHYRLSTNVTEFTVEAPGPGVIVLAEAYEEGNFRVSLNGAPVPYFRMNHVFKGVRVETAGSYTIRFEYWPRLLTLSLWLMAAGLLSLVLLVIRLARLPDHRLFPRSEQGGISA